MFYLQAKTAQQKTIFATNRSSVTLPSFWTTSMAQAARFATEAEAQAAFQRIQAILHLTSLQIVKDNVSTQAETPPATPPLYHSLCARCQAHQQWPNCRACRFEDDSDSLMTPHDDVLDAIDFLHRRANLIASVLCCSIERATDLASAWILQGKLPVYGRSFSDVSGQVFVICEFIGKQLHLLKTVIPIRWTSNPYQALFCETRNDIDALFEIIAMHESTATIWQTHISEKTDGLRKFTNWKQVSQQVTKQTQTQKPLSPLAREHLERYGRTFYRW